MPRYKNDGNKCAIPWHNHHPRDCPGRARIMCAVCGKSLISHKTIGFCEANEDKPVHVIDEVGKRRKMKS